MVYLQRKYSNRLERGNLWMAPYLMVGDEVKKKVQKLDIGYYTDSDHFFILMKLGTERSNSNKDRKEGMVIRAE